MLQYSNFNLSDIVTPVNADVLGELLTESGYDAQETGFLVQGFKKGFSLGYSRKEKVQLKAQNLKLRVGNPTILWNKIMKEVKLGRFAGPFEDIPEQFQDDYIQSPIGLVPKDGGKQCRLIFHLSHPRNDRDSVNTNTPQDLCSVSYPDFDLAVKQCLKEGIHCMVGKSDGKSAFRNLGISPRYWRYLIMKATNPRDGKTYFFLDKCLPFGAAISCALFQRVSNALAYLVRWRTKVVHKVDKPLVNYLDDFLFVALLRYLCNAQMEIFMKICEQVGFPIAPEKTVWGTTQLVFLGLLLDTVNQLVLLPREKVITGQNIVNDMLNRKSRKTTVHELQKLTGFLNFLGRAVVPGRVFTRRMYAYTRSNVLKPHHHVRINSELRADLMMWREFLHDPTIFAQPFLDFSSELIADVLKMYSDSSKNPNLGFGAICQHSWMYSQWDSAFIREKDPSIEYLELWAVVAGVITWLHRFCNRRIVLFCDNMSVVEMINHNSSSCKNCMVLLRILVLHSLKLNVRVFARHVTSRNNDYSDALSRLKLEKFWQISREKGDYFEQSPTNIPEQIWPIQKIWIN